MNRADNIISLRPITIEDTDLMVKWRNRDFVKRNYINQSEFTREGHLKWMETRVQTGQVIQFIILENDRPIGSANMKDVDYEKGTAEYGIFIGEKDALGKGYGSETAKQVVRLAKEKYHLKKLFLRLYEDNIPAYRSYLSAGFKKIEDECSIENDRKVIFMELEL